MAIKKYKPTTNARRNYTTIDYKTVLSQTDNNPEKSLLKKVHNVKGRNNQGKITTRHKGGGHKKRYRIIDFKRTKDAIPATIKTIEYDPNRSAFISLVFYADGEKKYIITPKNIKVGDIIENGENAPVQNGNCLPLSKIPEGTFIHNIELHPKAGATLVRSAGTSAQLLAHDEDGKYTTIKMSSKEQRKVLSKCRATIGVIANAEHSLVSIGKAGRQRWKGIKPTVRGSVMNPNDHPHGGGEGKSPVGRKSPLTPWGKKALGVKTRNKKKPSSQLITRRRTK